MSAVTIITEIIVCLFNYFFTKATPNVSITPQKVNSPFVRSFPQNRHDFFRAIKVHFLQFSGVQTTFEFFGSSQDMDSMFLY